jgi:hypothetical protein
MFGFEYVYYVERREEEETEEEKAVVLPVILNCRDWARMATPVACSWIKLIWKPLPVGQPDVGGLTVVDPSEVRTFCFKTTLVFGYDAWERKLTPRREQCGRCVSRNPWEAEIE